jgi:outer membrane cobalamin receptor
LDTGLDVRSGPDGSFSFAEVGPGTRSVAIVTSGCVVSFAAFDATEASLAPLVIQVQVRATAQDLAPPDPLPGSRLLSGEDIEELHVGTMVELLRRVAPELIQSVPGQPGGQPRITSRGVASAMEPVSPLLVVDGVNLGSLESPDVLESIQPTDIAYLEISRGSIGGWSYGTGGSGGVIRVTTRRGGTLSPPDLDLTRCAIPNWRRRPLDL